MNEHEQYVDDLALYALDALHGEERVRLDAHLAACAACRLELEQLRGDTALLALSAAGARPPQRARQRLLNAVAREPRVPRLVQTQPRRSWWGVLGWAATAAVVIFALSLWRGNFTMEDAVGGGRSHSTRPPRALVRMLPNGAAPLALFAPPATPVAPR